MQTKIDWIKEMQDKAYKLRCKIMKEIEIFDRELYRMEDLERERIDDELKQMALQQEAPKLKREVA